MCPCVCPCVCSGSRGKKLDPSVNLTTGTMCTQIAILQTWSLVNVMLVTYQTACGFIDLPFFTRTKHVREVLRANQNFLPFVDAEEDKKVKKEDITCLKTTLKPSFEWERFSEFFTWKNLLRTVVDIKIKRRPEPPEPLGNFIYLPSISSVTY